MLQLDDHTPAALNRIAAPNQRKRSELIRHAIRKAIRHEEFHAMREAYRKQPDSALDTDDWSTAEEYKACFQIPQQVRCRGDHDNHPRDSR